jgi:type IV pilus assembly protein PilN
MPMQLHELHPSLVHAPLTLLPAAALVDVMAASASGRLRRRVLDRIGRSLWWAGVGAAALAGVAGMAASQEVRAEDPRAHDAMWLHGMGNVGVLLAGGGLAAWRSAHRVTTASAALGASAVGGLVIVGLWYSVLEQLTDAQIQRNDFLKAEIGRLETQIKDIAELRAEIDALKARQKAVEDLQSDRNTPVHLLNELVRQVPEGVYLKSIRQTGSVVAIDGVAQTNERVSEFLRNTLYNSPWLERPELVEIKASNVGTAARGGQQRLFDFSMRVSLKRQPAPAAAASAPARRAANT